ncbi:MAG: 50S ribosomal protein L6 [Bacteroidetes bacterium]|uniref:Large ribosomal subunit protein uL6 n=1 Tax=Phaeocystidibacter marisrubri TaxID=1577780 RepID=A0A6L3ZDM0_9FLAO|nr:50S ribosomal protein L6 [Phaeocystidibacter marisrubri]KAB2815770.1 50S ribosomal protein L6 [Phaeocystidibacter marisrubri]TNE28505.1 MAG: 50S ribosomal protein L6 [Bacteroidota bacterium]GGH65614.1 50S ribosomal protein L6 [Phaeocystidibacter marisrubri]
MSRIGKAPIAIPQGVEVQVNGNVVTVKGKLGELTQVISEPNISASVEEGVINVERANDEKPTRAQHGLYRALINNMVVGVSEGFKKELELVGVGYRAANQGQLLDISVGYSHNIVFELPSEIKVETKSDKGKNPLITLTSHDKQLLGAVAAKIRSFRKPEPYKGKGIRFVGEHIRRKAGKSAAKK